MASNLRVSISRCFSYEENEIRQAIESCLRPIGGLESFISKNDRVLLKPNFVSAKPVSQACNTHPEFIFAVCKMIKELGAIPVIGESPALGSSMATAKKMGMSEKLNQEQIEIIDFTGSAKVKSEKGHCHFKMANEINQYDKIINLPKLKSHSQMKMTCCVKNLFGFVVGRNKAGLHMSIGHHEDWFSAMILDVADLVKPTLNIVDGIIALEKGGPINGSPINLGIIAAGQDPIAIDTVIYDLLKVNLQKIPLYKEAVRQQRRGTDLKDIPINYNSFVPSDLPDFQPRENLLPISFTPWHIFKGYIKQLKRRICGQ